MAHLLADCVFDDKTKVTRICYFNYGSVVQYKNYINLVILGNHIIDFNGMEFFSTSHNKSSCDRVGGTTKRLAIQDSNHQLTNY